MTLSGDRHGNYLTRLGARLLSEANDLKRTPEALAQELGWDIVVVRRVIDGTADVATAKKLLMAMVEAYPISLASVWIEPDDTDEGVLVMPASASAVSSRVFARPDKSGLLGDYYDYRDTAMSRLAPYRPEWIQPLRVVSDDDPNNADVAFNNGHLMHQLTYFMGDVNFYWIAGGRKHCRQMNKGDSCYITPFTPHSFTSRDSSRLGAIVAVTYGAAIARSLDALSRLSPDTVDRLSGERREPRMFLAARIERYRNSNSLSVSGLADRLVTMGLDAARVQSLLVGSSMPNPIEIDALARALDVLPSDLTIETVAVDDPVVVRRAYEASDRAFPDTNRPVLRLRDLAHTCTQTDLRGFAVETTGKAPDAGSAFEHHLHEYIYIDGAEPVQLMWGQGRSRELYPGDSAYVGPMVPHLLHGVGGAHAVVVRVPGDLTNSVFNEFSLYDAHGRGRAVREKNRWF